VCVLYWGGGLAVTLPVAGSDVHERLVAYAKLLALFAV